MLKGIDPCFEPELLCALAKAGHGDRIAIVDRNYPAYAAGAPVFHLDMTTDAFAERFAELVPIDSFVERPVQHMQDAGIEGRNEVQQQAVDAFERVEGRAIGVQPVERMDFYAQAKEASVVIALTESRPYACFLITKGVVFDS